jgi:hypothetical protein
MQNNFELYYRFVTLSPESGELNFSPPKPGEPSNQLKTTVVITSILQAGNLAYKIKTTAPKAYVVKPNQGIIEPGQKVEIDIAFVPVPVRFLPKSLQV